MSREIDANLLMQIRRQTNAPLLAASFDWLVTDRASSAAAATTVERTSC